MDRDITRGLLESLRYFFNPPRTYAILDLQRAFLEERLSVTVRQLHELLLHVPTTVKEMLNLPQCACLLSPAYVMPTMNGAKEAELEGQADDGSGDRTLGLCVLEVIRGYLRGRGFSMPCDEAVPVCHFVALTSLQQHMKTNGLLPKVISDKDSSPAASPKPELDDLETAPSSSASSSSSSSASSSSSSSSSSPAVVTIDELLNAVDVEETLSTRLEPNVTRYIGLLYERLALAGDLHLPLTAEQFALVQAISFALFGGRSGTLLEKGSGAVKLHYLSSYATIDMVF